MTTGATIRIAAMLALCHVGLTAAAPGLQVRAVKFWSLGNSTRIAIEVSAEFSYRKDRLENPDRMFFDIADAQPRIEGSSPRGQHVIAVNDKFVRQIRVAEPQRGITRVVLDLEAGVECVASQLTDPDRLMIEVTAPGRSEPPSVTPSVVVVKRFESPVAPPRRADPRRQISWLDEPPPQIVMKPVPLYIFPSPKSRRLLASAVARPPTTEPAVVKSVQTVPEGAPLPAKRNAAGDRSMTRVFGLKIKRVIIDAGHGGKDEGSRGPSGLLEKELVLDVAKRLGDLVQERLGLEVIYTRADDRFIALEQRTRIANDQRGDLFISIHANSSAIRAVTGVEVYYLNLSSIKLDLDTAARENAGAESSVYELQTLLQKAMLNDKLKESSEFAGKVLQAMVGPPTSKTTRSRGVRRAPFVVLIGAHMPSILCEIGFLSNPADEALMMKATHRQKIAESLTRGIQDFVQSLSRFQVATQPAAARPASGQ